MSMTAIARMEMDRRKAIRAEEHASALTSAGGPWQLKMGGRTKQFSSSLVAPGPVKKYVPSQTTYIHLL